jgi:excisionase family DNA binding protein
MEHTNTTPTRIAMTLDAPRPYRLAVKIPEAADIVGVSSKTIRRAIERGEIRPNRKLRHVLIPVAELERFVNA